MKFREHRRDMAESMATAVEVNGLEGLVTYIRILAEPWPTFPPVTPDTIHFARYSGIGINTYIVTLEGYGVLGFTDSKT